MAKQSGKKLVNPIIESQSDSQKMPPNPDQNPNKKKGPVREPRKGRNDRMILDENK